MIPSITERKLLGHLTRLLLTMMPDDVPVLRAQVNRVPTPMGDFVMLTPLRRLRISTNIESGADVMLVGTIAGETLTVDDICGGTLEIGRQLIAAGIAPYTRIVARNDDGTWRIKPKQQGGTGTIYAGYWQSLQHTEVITQIDVYGEHSAEIAQVISTLMRDPYATEWFAQHCPAATVLYADDPREMPFIDAESQYEERWLIEAHMQANMAVPYPMQYADWLKICAIEVDSTYRSS